MPPVVDCPNLAEVPVCPFCHRSYLVWDDDTGSWYCANCDSSPSDEDIKREQERIDSIEA